MTRVTQWSAGSRDLGVQLDLAILLPVDLVSGSRCVWGPGVLGFLSPEWPPSEPLPLRSAA